MKTQIQTLKDTIHMHNEFNRIAAPILLFVQQVSNGFIGKKIDTLKGLSAKYQEAIKIDRESIDIKPIDGAKYAKLHLAYVTTSYGDLTLKISICFSDGGHGCTYKENTFWFGKVENGILMSVNNDVKPSQTVLDLNDQIAAIKNYLLAVDAMEKAKDKIKVGREVYQYFSLDKF